VGNQQSVSQVKLKGSIVEKSLISSPLILSAGSFVDYDITLEDVYWASVAITQSPTGNSSVAIIPSTDSGAKFGSTGINTLANASHQNNSGVMVELQTKRNFVRVTNNNTVDTTFNLINLYTKGSR
jgi:hypothetical protein